MPPLAPFPDVEGALVQRLTTGLSGVTVGTYVPDDLKLRMPFLFVYRFAGNDNGIEDRALVGVDTFAATRSVGLVLAEQARQLITAAPFVAVLGADAVVIDTVDTVEAPHEVAYGDSAVRRWVSSFELTLRR